VGTTKEAFPAFSAEINMNLELENKTALVTGSTAGIGLAIAASLARESATVIINGRTKKRVNDAINQILGQYLVSTQMRSLSRWMQTYARAQRLQQRSKNFQS
jgi:NAD(P)-dependent dehydrogenase (short-subunit alcohol dehydrogenase family)